MEECKRHVADQNVVRPEDLVELEVIDLQAPEEVIISKVMNNLRSDGFFAIENVEGYDEGELFRAIKAFYKDIPAEEHYKLLWRNFNPENDNVVRGRTPICDNSVSSKEMFDIGGDLELLSDEALPMPLYEETPFPPHEEY